MMSAPTNDDNPTRYPFSTHSTTPERLHCNSNDGRTTPTHHDPVVPAASPGGLAREPHSRSTANSKGQP